MNKDYSYTDPIQESYQQPQVTPESSSESEVSQENVSIPVDQLQHLNTAFMLPVVFTLSRS